MVPLNPSDLLELWERGRTRHAIDQALLLFAAARPDLPATVRHFGSGQEWKVQTPCGDSIRRSSVTCTQRWQFLRPIAQGSKRWQALNLIFAVATKGTNIKGRLSSPCEPKISSDGSTRASVSAIRAPESA